MKNLMTVALAAFLLQGCSQLVVNPEFEVPAPVMAAENLQAALTAYGKPNAKPEVHWYGPKAVTCTGTCNHGGRLQGLPWQGFTNPQTGECVTGLTEGDLTIVMAPDSSWALWPSALAHELIHNEEVLGVHDHPVEFYGSDPTTCSDPTGSTLQKGVDAMFGLEPVGLHVCDATHTAPCLPN